MKQGILKINSEELLIHLPKFFNYIKQFTPIEGCLSYEIIITSEIAAYEFIGRKSIGGILTRMSLE